MMSCFRSVSEDEDGDGAAGCASLLEIIVHIESTPDVCKYAMIGLRHWSSALKLPHAQFSNCQLSSFVFVNLDLTAGVTFDRNSYFWDEVDFNLRLQRRGSLCCRFNELVVMRKHVSAGGRTEFTHESAGERVSLDSYLQRENEYKRLVAAPDTVDCAVFTAPARYLLELYLAARGRR